MEAVSFRCTSCKQALKLSADKIGKRIRCPKCATELVVPKSSASAAPADEDGGGGYGIVIDKDEEAARQKRLAEADKKTKKAKVDRAFLPKAKRKSLQEPENWQRVRTGLVVMMWGVVLLGGPLLFVAIVWLLGILSGPYYATVALRHLFQGAPQAIPGQMEPMNYIDFFVGIVAGGDYVGIGKVLLILGSVCLLLQSLVCITGYIIALPIPNRFSTKGQLWGLISVSIVNFIVNGVLRLLPLAGAMGYILIPLVIPELNLLSAAMDRGQPMGVFWSKAPFWESILFLFIMMSFYAEPVLIGSFIWSVGLSLKEEPVAERGRGIINLTFGVAFAHLCLFMLGLTGSSNVMVWVFRAIYCLWLLFFVLLILRLAFGLNFARVILDKYLAIAAEEEEMGKVKKRVEDAEDEEEEEEEEDEEDEEEEDEDEEDEDEDEEDEEDRRPRRRRRRDDDDEDED
ncbi:MAG: hypothetical protein L0215_08015 [Gemmataceae bacterium]|nr:hypothetical protein [Gemmataceae bacterium]